MNIETAVKLAKPFVGSLTKNPGDRPVLKTALVTEEYVIATDSHKLIRIKHDEPITEPYLHKYKDYDELFGMEATNYPSMVHRLIPEQSNAISSGPLDTKEMVEAIEGACIAAEFNSKNIYEQMLKENENVAKHLKKSKDSLKAQSKNHVRISSDTMAVKPNVQNFETGEYTYTFDKAIPIPEETAFNPAYLKTIFKTFKAAKEKEINSHFYSKLRPWLLTAGDTEVILLPVRTY